jgi:hypothetical protein
VYGFDLMFSSGAAKYWFSSYTYQLCQWGMFCKMAEAKAVRT